MNTDYYTQTNLSFSLASDTPLTSKLQSLETTCVLLLVSKSYHS